MEKASNMKPPFEGIQLPERLGRIEVASAYEDTTTARTILETMTDEEIAGTLSGVYTDLLQYGKT